LGRSTVILDRHQPAQLVDIQICMKFFPQAIKDNNRAN